LTYIEITLDQRELEVAVQEGNRRQDYNQARNIKGRNNGPQSGKLSYDISIAGCIGEYAAAKYLELVPHLFQEEKPVRGSFDLPPNIDVKTAQKHSHNLIIQLDESPQKIFLHATHESGSVVYLHGWSYGSRVMKDQFERDPVGNRPAYFVTPAVLHPMQLLKDFILDLYPNHEANI
jgi:hypothetical protein